MNNEKKKIDKVNNVDNIEKLKKEKKSLKEEIIEWVFCFIIAYVIYLVINYFLGTVSGVKQVSMVPTAKEGDKVIISRRVIFNKPIERGQIITFEAPYFDPGYSRESDIADYVEFGGISKFTYKVIGIGKRSYIKRVIALAGDEIYISEDGDVFLNDEKLDEEYLNGISTNRIGEKYSMTVPENCIYVMGDNRNQSRDSREFGAVPIEKVEGNVLTRIWPLSRLGKLDK